MDLFSQKKTIYVATGEIKSACSNVVIKSDGIGSCGVVVVYDTSKKIGAVAHIMLPGEASQSSVSPHTHYAHNAIEELLKQMIQRGANTKDVSSCIIGCGNVLKKTNDMVCSTLVNSISTYLDKKEILVCKQAVGGFKRRRMLFDVESGSVFFTEGDNSYQELICFLKHIETRKGLVS